jgi:hypothetical protein
MAVEPQRPSTASLGGTVNDACDGGVSDALGGVGEPTPVHAARPIAATTQTAARCMNVVIAQRARMSFVSPSVACHRPSRSRTEMAVPSMTCPTARMAMARMSFCHAGFSRLMYATAMSATPKNDRLRAPGSITSHIPGPSFNDVQCQVRQRPWPRISTSTCGMTLRNHVAMASIERTAASVSASSSSGGRVRSEMGRP